MNDTICRFIDLIDPNIVPAVARRAYLYRNPRPKIVDEVEKTWAPARKAFALESRDAGLTAAEHSDWDWRRKAQSVESSYHTLVAIVREGIPQGMMAVLRSPINSRLSPKLLVYVDYLEAAPWNIRRPTIPPRLIDVGTVLIAEAVRISFDVGLDGRLGLHSLPQAEAFYKDRCRMTEFDFDSDSDNLKYFEFSESQAADWLNSIGGY